MNASLRSLFTALLVHLVLGLSTLSAATVTATAGQSATFTASASGTAPFTYAWKKNGVVISGATSAVYSISSLSASDAGSYTVTVSNSAGSSTSTASDLTVNATSADIAISAQPVSSTVTAGSAASFSVTATGTAPFTYQWKKDGVALSGATSASLSIASATTANAGTYTVVVSNATGSITSSGATLTVQALVIAPSISSQPVSSTVTAGSAASFSVTASGTAPFSYQWKKDGVALSGATSASLSIASTSATHAGSYTVVVSNAAGSITSSAATLTVQALVIAPSISSQPASSTVSAGSAASFSITASGTAPLAYQWKKDGVALSGATSASLSISSTKTVDTGSYSVTVTNAAGSITSNAATLTVNELKVVPSFTTQPASLSVNAGKAASFSVVVTGTAPFTYQWRKDGSVIAGATSDTYSIAAASSADVASYTVTVSNAAGAVTSKAATLTITQTAIAPTISSQPLSTSASVGQTASFSVSASGTAPFTYQWFKDGVALSGATTASLSIKSVTDADAAAYTVTVSNEAGSITSSKANLAITAEVKAPEITKQPVGLSVTTGQSASFSVEVSGTAPFSYQWKRGGYAIAGATASTFTIASTTANDTGAYSVSITNSTGSVLSNAVALQVNAAVLAPVISNQPESATSLAGSAVSFSVTATGSSPISYQWKKNGTAIQGANASSFSISAISADDAGLYTVTLTNSTGSVTSNAAALVVSFPPVVDNPTPDTPTTQVPATSRISNVSVRSVLDGASGPLIIGFNVAGGSKDMLIRCTGPALTSFGVSGALSDPALTLYSGNTAVAFNDNWGDKDASTSLSKAFDKVGAFGLSNTASKDAAILTQVDGLRSVQVSSAVPSEKRGVVLLEVYDQGTGSKQRLTNVSVRNYAGTGSDSLIIGFTIDGPGTKRVLVRGVGPGLNQFGVTGTIADPKLDLYTNVNGEVKVVASNDSWQDDKQASAAFALCGAFSLPDASKDAAFVLDLPAGAYTAMLSGVNGTTGNALVEVYELP